MKKSQPKAYAAAGVDIELGNRVKATLPGLLASTRRKGVLGKVGGFGGLFALDLEQYREPVLVSSVDGVGTKLKIAFALNRHDTIGQDLVNHCVNDIAVLGAEPLFFLDYLGTGKLEPHVFTDIIKGFARACAENRCALIGGETAQMPGFYRNGEYDVSGTIVGVVERSRMLYGARTVRAGDAIIGIASSGLHTNGYSLARKILFDRMKLKPTSHVAELGTTVGDELLKVHVSYGPLVQKLLGRFNRESATPALRAAARDAEARQSTRTQPKAKAKVRAANGSSKETRTGSGTEAEAEAASLNSVQAFAHITGGGFVDNIPRVLPSRCDAVIRKNSWELPPIFQLLQRHGRVAEAELYQVFNMGIGMVALVTADRADAVLRFIRRNGHPAWIIGEVTPGTGTARVE